MKMAEPIKKLLKRNKPGTKASVRRFIFVAVSRHSTMVGKIRSTRTWSESCGALEHSLVDKMLLTLSSGVDAYDMDRSCSSKAL